VIAATGASSASSISSPSSAQHRGRHRRRAVPHLHAHRRADRRRVASQLTPRATTPRPSSASRGPITTRVRRADRDDEHRLGEAAGKPAPLPDGVARVAVVLPDHAPVAARSGRARATARVARALRG
jgi:hypothetical protein